MRNKPNAADIHHFCQSAYDGDIVGIAAYLEEFGAEAVDAQDQWHQTALMCAASQGELEAMKTLIKHGAYIDTKSEDKETALLLATVTNQQAAVALLLEQGADPTIKNSEGMTAGEIAHFLNYDAIADMLQPVEAAAAQKNDKMIETLKRKSPKVILKRKP